jgi:ferredoxin
MFARGLYQPGDGRFEQFYSEFPELKELDEIFRKLPGMGEPGSATYDPHNPEIAMSIFRWISRVRDTAEGEQAEEKHALPPNYASRRLKGLARFLGAVDAGTTAVDSAHVYSRIGRGSGKWGDEIDPVLFPYALVFTVEMNPAMMAASPLQPVVVDSSRQYLHAAIVALAIAEYLRSLGYQARAHIDGNYRLIMPPLAVDAGLGEIGRHSLLITPEQGSRVRIGAVTTDLPLEQDAPVSFGVQDFCRVCRKCTLGCPPKAIPDGEKEELRGTTYWKINPDSCYRYWHAAGTDCGLCVTVCPYSRPKGALHSFVRAACRRSRISRRIFARADDLFYGRIPRNNIYPGWMMAGMSDEDISRLNLREG